MNAKRQIEWLILTITAALLVFLDWLHLGVTNYNAFLLILLGWSLVLIVTFRALRGSGPSSQGS